MSAGRVGGGMAHTQSLEGSSLTSLQARRTSPNTALWESNECTPRGKRMRSSRQRERRCAGVRDADIIGCEAASHGAER